MKSKENDLMLNILANPHMNLGDFLSVGLSVDNTSLEDENVYLNSEIITLNPLFLTNGEFDKVKFHKKYIEATQALQNMTIDNNQDIFNNESKYNIFAPINKVDFRPLFELTKYMNPDRITRSMIVLGLDGQREKSPAELAQQEKVFNSETGKWMDTPENMFSFSKLFTDFLGFFSDNFGSTKVLAQYDEDVDINGNVRGEKDFNESLIEHYKGEYKLNDNGTYYYRTLKKGENIYGKLVLHYSDILTRENSALNSIDFLDSDDLEKNTIGSFIKNAALIGSLFLPGGIGKKITGATIFLQAAGLGATLGKIALGNDNTTMNWIEGLAKSTNPVETRSEYSQQNTWTTENLLGMTGDVIAQLWLQRLLFKYAPVMFKGKWGTSEKNQEALRLKIIGNLESQNKQLLSESINTARGQKIYTELLANAASNAARQVEEYMKAYYKTGEELSKAYMTLLTVNDIYGEAIEAGADRFDASLITLGYAAMEYKLLSSDIGKWILPELRANRLKNKAVVRAMSKDVLDTFRTLGKEASTSEAARKTYVQRLLDFGKSLLKGEFASGFGKRASIEGGEGLLAGGIGSIFAGATAEALEETSEELLGDFSRVLFNGLELLSGKSTRLKPFENAFDRYTMSFLGGFLGGGVSAYTMDFSEARKSLNMNYNQAILEVIYKARNNELDELYKILDKEIIGNNKLSARETVTDDEGNVIWKLADGNDNLDFAIKQIIRRLLNLIQNTLDAHGGNLSDGELLEKLTLRDIRYRVLHDTTTAGRFIQRYNELLTDLVTNVNELNKLNTPAVKEAAGEGDLKDKKSEELEKSRKIYQDRIKEIDKQIEDFNSGKLAPLFMTSALLESTPFISAPFMISNFKQYAEYQSKTKLEDIPENELQRLLIEYQNYLKTTKKDDLKLATEGYLNIQSLIRDNFELAKKVAQDYVNDPEIKDYLLTFTDTLSMFSQIIPSIMDNDTWIELLLKFVLETQIGDLLLNQIQLLRNTFIENNNLSAEKLNKMIQDASDAFESGTIDEETMNNTIDVANKEFDEETNKNRELFEKSRELLILYGLLQAAQNIADHILQLGYINGAIKSDVISKLQSAKNASELLLVDLLNDVENDPLNDSLINLYNEVLNQSNELSLKIEKINELPYTPILLNLDTFALTINGGSISKLLLELGNQINSNRSTLSAFILQRDVYKLINEALRTINLYIAALEGARIDSVDPFNIETNPLNGNVIDKSNVWGINRVLNEIHAKAPKIENDTWQDLPEIEGEIADMMLEDARSIKELLNTYVRLYNINEGLKLNVQTRVAVKTTYLLYDRLKRLLSNIDALRNFNISELEKTLSTLQFLESQTSGRQPSEYNINLSLEDQIKLEKERIALEDALYNFFNVDNPKLSTDIEKLKEFLDKNFKLLDMKTELLSEGATHIDETSIIGYIAAKAAIKTSDFYGKFKEIIADGTKAPIISLELGILLQLGNILNGNVITSFSTAYRELLKDKFRNASFEKRKEMLVQYGEDEKVAEFFATDEGSLYYPTHDSVPQFTNITFIDGIPGSGKSAAVDLLVIKFLLKYYPDILSNVWISHGGDVDNNSFTLQFKSDIGLGNDSKNALNRHQLMKKISDDWNSTKIENGESYEIDDSDYLLENGQIVPTWKLNNTDDVPSLIVIDEALQFTLFELMTIDKFARQHGIPVIMSGDLLQSKSKGNFTIPKDIILKINDLLKKNKSTTLFGEKTKMSIGLSRNQTLHTPKLGTSMRTANNLKNANLAIMQNALQTNDATKLNFHFYEDDTLIAGDFLENPNDIDGILRIIDKIIPLLKNDEKINYACNRKDSKILSILKNNKKYSDKINFIAGVALGQEGNYWIIEPKYSTDDKGVSEVEDVESFLSDLYTGISRSKIAGIIISPETLNGGIIKMSNILDLETHEIKYSEQAIKKYAEKRIEILNQVLGETNDIEYIPRNKEIPDEKDNIVKPSGLNPDSFLQEVERLKSEGKITDEPADNSELNEVASQFVEKGIQKIPIKGLGSGREYESEIIDFNGRPIMLIDINGFKMPFYISTGQGGKKTVQPGKWYPFFGINPTEGWLTKLYEEDINSFYGSPLLKAICDVLNSKYSGILTIDENGFVVKSNPYVNPENNEEIPLSDDKYNPMYDLINQTVGFGDRYHPNNTRKRIEELIELLHRAAGYINDNPNVEILEVINELDVSDQNDAEDTLNEATLEDNPESDKEQEPTGLSIEDMNFFLFSNATFELGTASIDRENNTYTESLIEERIDGVNGLKNCPKTKKIVGNLSESERVLGLLRRCLLSTNNKSDLEKRIAFILGLDKTYIRFAIKTSQLNTDGINRELYNKLEKDPKEPLLYCRALQKKYSESNYVNNRNLVAVIGNETDGDCIEISLLTLNNPITLLNIHDSDMNFKFPDVHMEYELAYNAAISSGSNYGEALVEGLKQVLQFVKEKPEYKGILNLINLYLRTDRNIVFIKDLLWTPTNNLHSFGPQLHIHRGESYDNPDYIQERQWISLDLLKADPTLYISKVYLLLDKSKNSLKLALPKHPFVLYTDLLYDHSGNILDNDINIIREYQWQRLDPKNRPLTIKLIYVLPPKFTLSEYILSLHLFMDINKDAKPLGNQRTAYKILETLFLTDINATKQLFIDSFGEDTGNQIYEKLVNVIGLLKDLSVKEQIVKLLEVQSFPSFNGIGLTTKVNLYRHLQHIIKQLVFPAGVTIEGRIVLKGDGNINSQILDRLNNIFDKSGLSLFYLCKSSKNIEDTIDGIFSPVLADSNGHINDDNISNKEFSINGNISSSTFLVEKEFNAILDNLVNNTLNVMSNGVVGSWDTPKYIGDPNYIDANKYPRGYSGWNRATQNNNPAPTISNSILLKLNSLGLTTSIIPTKVNDDSLELKQAIANEINNNSPKHIALVLPNGELIIGYFFNKKEGSNISIIQDGNSFESGQQFLFSIQIDEQTYNVVYNPLNKNAEFKYEETIEGNYDLNSYYDTILPEFVELNYDRFKLLLLLIASTNYFNIENREIAEKLLLNGNANNIAEFLNDGFGIMSDIVEADINDFDKTEFVDILKFEQEESKSCLKSIKVQFI